MKKTSAFLIVGIVSCSISAIATPEEDRQWATRVNCEIQTAGAQSLPALTFSQGSTPLVSLDQFRQGKAVNAETNGSVKAIFQFAPSPTSQYWVAVTNAAVSGNGYLVQLPTIGTNTTSGAWWYTAYYIRDGRRYWTGGGRLNIIETTATGDGLVWQEIVCSEESDPIALPVASAAYIAATNAARIASGRLRLRLTRLPTRWRPTRWRWRRTTSPRSTRTGSRLRS